VGFEPDGSIQVKAETLPSAAVLWQAANPIARHFGCEGIGPRTAALPEERGSSVPIAKSPAGARWAAYFIELTFPSGGLFPFKFTTGVRVAPDMLPFGPPPEMVRSQTRRQPLTGDHLPANKRCCA
jgi:PhoPQ-activated pathogenicity-related protein